MQTSPMKRVIDPLRRAVLLADGAVLRDGELLDRFLETYDQPAFATLAKRRGPIV